jgi:hypothetical protein
MLIKFTPWRTAPVVTVLTLSLMIMSSLGSMTNSALATPSVPICSDCSISGNGGGFISVPKGAQIVSCPLCGAKIEFHAQPLNGKITGAISITYFPGDSCSNCVISGIITGGVGVIADKVFILKGYWSCNRCGPIHFTLHGFVHRGTIIFLSNDDITGKFTGKVIVNG